MKEVKATDCDPGEMHILRTTKEDILDYILEYQTMLNDNSRHDTNHSAAYYHTASELLSSFKADVEGLVLFKELEDGWGYDVGFNYDGIKLGIVYHEPFERNGEKLYDYQTSQSYTLFERKVKYLTVDEYADRYKISTTTVRQWIRRGKIRTAHKQGNEWRIPELTDLPKRGITSSYYEWDNSIEDVPEKFAFIKKYISAFIYRDDDDKSTYYVQFDTQESKEDPFEHKPKEYSMDIKKKEMLELFLISNPGITYIPNIEETLIPDMMRYYGGSNETNNE